MTQSAKLLLCFLYPSIFLLVFVYMPMVNSPFAVADDYYFWGYNHDKPDDLHPQYIFIITIGRYLTSFFLMFWGKLINTLEDLILVRRVALAVIIVSLACYALWISKVLKKGKEFSFLLAANFFLLPGMQAQLAWSGGATCQPYTMMLSILIVVCLERITPKKITDCFCSRHDLVYIFIALCLFMLSLSIHQLLATFFLIFTALRILFATTKTNWNIIRWTTLRDLAFFTFGCGIYFLVQKLIVLPKVAKHIQNHPVYKLELDGLEAIPAKIQYFFTEFTSYGFHIWDAHYQNHSMPWELPIFIFIGVLATLVHSVFRSEKKQIAQDIFTTGIQATLFLIIIAIFINLPNLAGHGSKLYHLSIFSFACFLLSLLVWALVQICSLIGSPSIKNFTINLILSIAVLIAGYIAQKDTSFFAKLQEMEYHFVESTILPHIRDSLPVHVVSPLAKTQHIVGKYAGPSTEFEPIAFWMVNSIFLKHGIKPDLTKITISKEGEPFIIPERTVVVNAQDYASTFFPDPPPLQVDFIQGNLHGFDLFFIRHSKATKFYGVPHLEYDPVKKRCKEPACSMVIKGDTLADIKKAIDTIHKVEKMDKKSINTYGKLYSANAGDPHHAFDRNETSTWYIDNSSSAWVQIDLGVGNEEAVTTIQFMAAHYTWSGAGIKNFNFEGSLDNKSWTTLLSNDASNHLSWQVFHFSNKIPYRYYRVKLNSTYGPHMGLQEIKLYKDR